MPFPLSVPLSSLPNTVITNASKKPLVCQSHFFHIGPTFSHFVVQCRLRFVLRLSHHWPNTWLTKTLSYQMLQTKLLSRRITISTLARRPSLAILFIVAHASPTFVATSRTTKHYLHKCTTRTSCLSDALFHFGPTFLSSFTNCLFQFSPMPHRKQENI